MPRRGENIFKRKDGRWEARYVKEVALDGSKKYASVYAKTYHEVKTKRLVCINQPSMSTKKSAATVDEIMQEWLEESKIQVIKGIGQLLKITFQRSSAKSRYNT